MLSEFIRLFPEDLQQVTSELRVPGPLRLTLARPFWHFLSPMNAAAAGIDILIVLLGAIAIAELVSVNLWGALGVMAVAYHAIGTAICGCSFATCGLRMRLRRLHSKAPWVLLLALAIAAPANAQQSTFKPEVGQAGKDVVWVPTPEVMVERMLDLVKVTPADYVIDLGSGDGRNVIGAAKRGANALGVEYNPDMVALSKRLAMEAGVADKAQFVQGDMFLADISKANVMALFLLPSNLLRLREKFLELRPGSRIVSNTFSIQDWEADETVTIDQCEQWCTAMVYIVPAKVGGTWKVGSDVLELKQEYQKLSGTWTSGSQATQVSGFLKGSELTLKAGTKAISEPRPGEHDRRHADRRQRQVLLARDSLRLSRTPNSQTPNPKPELPNLGWTLGNCEVGSWKLTSSATGCRWSPPNNPREVIRNAVGVREPDGAESGAEVAERRVDLHVLRLGFYVNGFNIRHDVLNAGICALAANPFPKSSPSPSSFRVDTDSE